MQNKMKYYVILAVLILFSACGANNMSQQHYYQGFENNAWPIGKTISFSFDVADTAQVCNITANLRYTKAFSFSSLNMSVVLLTPSGSSRFNKISIPVTTNGGDRNGTQMKDYIELPFSVYKSIRFAEKGKWVLNFTHNMPIDIYQGLVGIEISLAPQ
jgi:gliding motility-associated lipoprotein GldH